MTEPVPIGDLTDDDVYDTADADPEAVARFLLGALRARDPRRFRRWDDHTPAERRLWIAALGELLLKLRREGSA